MNQPGGEAGRSASPLPKAELHCHIEGAASPRLAMELARRQGVDISAIVQDGAYVWNGFTGFLSAYDRVASLFRDPADYARLAEEHLTGLAADGALYAEMFVSPDHARASGLSPDIYVEALAEGMARAETAAHITARMIVVGVRHLGAERVEAAAAFAAGCGHPMVTGFGLAGDERVGEPAHFRRAFDLAREAGLGLTCHAGEFRGAESIRETLDHLRPTRIGHGVRAIEDRALAGRLAADGMVLEICPGSNLALGVFATAADHPLRQLVEAGVTVTLNSDDPPFFATTLGQEYGFARDEHGFGEADLLGFTRNAVEAAFVDGPTRRRLLDQLPSHTPLDPAEAASDA